MPTNRIRVPRKDRQRLKALKQHPEIQERLGTNDPTYEEVLALVFEVCPEVTLETPDEDMVFVNLEETHKIIHERAGENETARDVVAFYLDVFEEEMGIDQLDGDEEDGDE